MEAYDPAGVLKSVIEEQTLYLRIRLPKVHLTVGRPLG